MIRKVEGARQGKGTPVPLSSPLVPIILINEEEIRIAKTIREKRELLAHIAEDSILLAPWPGEWSQDVFLLEPSEVVEEMESK